MRRQSEQEGEKRGEVSSEHQLTKREDQSKKKGHLYGRYDRNAGRRGQWNQISSQAMISEPQLHRNSPKWDNLNCISETRVKLHLGR